MFDQSVIESIQFYVYILKDPITKEIFYIGKWFWNRVFDHASHALETDDESYKLDRIKDILYKWKQIEYSIVRHWLSEDIAREIEATLIDIFRWKQTLKSDITNKVSGFHSYKRWIMSVNEIKQFYWWKEIKITDPVMLININKLYKRNMTENELYEAISKSWKVGKDREKVKYVLWNYKGIVREVYEVKDWYSIKDHNWKIRRWFNGKIANDNIREKYINWLIKDYIKKWASNPVRYINC